MININCAKKGNKIFNLLRLIKIISLFSIIFSFINPITSFETPKKIQNRFKYFSKLQKISNNKVKIEYDTDRGFYCKANDFIKDKDQLYDVPKSLTLSPFYIFPFKFEFIEILANIEEIKNSKSRDSTLANYLFVFQYLIYRYVPKRTLKEFIKENEYVDYYDYFEPDPQVINSFPSFVPTLINYSREDVSILSRMNFIFTEIKDIGIIFEKVIGSKKDFIRRLFAPIFTYNRIREAYAMIKSRHFMFIYDDFYKMEGYTENNPNNSNIIKKNNQANRNMYRAGFPLLPAYIDLCNHGQSKTFSHSNNNFIKVEVRKDFVEYYSANNWKPGNEILHNYSLNPSTFFLSINYGFVLKKNIYDEIEINVKDNVNFNLDQINLCRDIGCFAVEVKTRSQILKERKDLINNNRLNENLLNYGRVRQLKKKFDYKKIYKNLMRRKYISNANEMASYLFYFKVLTENMEYEVRNIFEIFTEGSIIKNELKNSNFALYDEDKEIREKWKKLKVTELVFDASFMFKNILILHANTILDKIIKNSSRSIENIREKYLNKFK
jgi:hypothetical protein